MNIGKWVLRNLFIGFIKEESRRQALEKPQPSAYKGSQWGLTPAGTTTTSHPRSASDVSSGMRSPGSSTPVAPDSGGVTRGANLKLQSLSPIPQSPSHGIGSTEATPRPSRESVPVGAQTQEASTATPQPRPTSPVSMSSPATSSSTSSIAPPPTSATSPGPSSGQGQGNADYFSLKRRGSTAGQSTPDDFGGWSGPGGVKGQGGISSSQDAVPTTPATPGGGFMGRLKNLGKSSRRTATDVETPSATISSSTTADESDSEKVCLQRMAIDLTLISSKANLVPQQKTFAQRLKSQPYSPPSSAECPPLSIPPSTIIVITEESEAGWNPLFRAPISDIGADSQGLEELMPGWLLEFLYLNRTPAVPLNKVSFVLLPAPVRPGENEEQLPELLNTYVQPT